MPAMLPLYRVLLAALVLVAAFPSKGAAQDINTYPPGSTPVDYTRLGTQLPSPDPGGEWWGSQYTNVGQTFTVGLPVRLNSFSFWVAALPSRRGLDRGARAMVYEWSVDRPGRLLWASDVDWYSLFVTQFTVDVGGIVLPANRMYVAMVTDVGSDFRDEWPFVMVNDVYTGGMAVRLGAPPGEYTSMAWEAVPDRDFAFAADFSPIPEPVTMLLVGSGLAGIAAVRRRRRWGVYR